MIGWNIMERWILEDESCSQIMMLEFIYWYVGMCGFYIKIKHIIQKHHEYYLEFSTCTVHMSE